MTQVAHAFAETPQTANLLSHWYALLDHIHIGVYICDRDGVLLRFNAHAAELWGLSPPTGQADVKYSGCWKAYELSGEPLEASAGAIGTVLRTGKPVHGRAHMIERPDGKRLYLLANADPLYDDAGEIIGAVNCIQDITAQEEAKAREAQGKYLLETIIETTPECIKVVAADGTLLQMNTAGREMLQRPAAQLIGSSVFDLIAPEHREEWKSKHARVCRGEMLNWDFDIIVARGKRRHVETHAAPLKMPDGSLAQLAVTRDVTARQDYEHDLRESKTQLQEVLEALPAAVYTTDAEGRVTFFNQAAIELAGCSPRIGEDQWCVTWKLYRPDGTPLPHDECPMAIALKENRSVRGEEAVAERPDGVRIPFIPYPTPIRDAFGNLVGAINMLVDISERKQAEYQQRMLLDELNHRVKNNMQMLYSLLRTAQRETPNSDAQRVLEDAANRIGAIGAAQRVLYSAASATTFNTSEFVEAVCQAARQAFAGDVTIQVNADAGDLPNEVSMPLALILNELLTNALKHGRKGRQRGIVNVQLSRSADTVQLAVEDDGEGFTLQPSNRRSSGLGLVAGLARQIGGTFEVDRTPGARCIVSFSAHGHTTH